MRFPALRCSPTTAVSLAAIVSIPLIFLIVTRGEWMLDAGGQDNWIYIKYFHVWANPHRELREAMDQHYKATRLPWIVPGFLAYRAFGPLVGTYVLHVAVLVSGALALWAGTRRLFGPGVATLTTLILMAYPGFHSGGIMRFWNYHAQVNLVYYLLAMLCVVMGATGHDRRAAILWHLGAGAAIAASVFTGFTYVVVLPAFGVFALAALGRWNPRGLGLMVVAGLVGAIVGTALFGVANLLTGGPFLFFWRQITYSFEWAGREVGHDPVSVWFPPWFKQANWLGIPPLVTLAALLALVPLARSTQARSRRWLVVGCWLALLTAWAALIASEAKGQELIEIAYQFQMILGPTAYAMAALFWLALRLDARPLPLLAVVALVPALVVPQIILDARLRQWLRQALDPAQVLPLWPSELWLTTLVLLAGGVLLVLAVRSRRSLAIGGAGLVAGFGLALSALDANGYLPPERCSYLLSQYTVIQQMIVRTSDEEVDTRALLWYDPEERLPRSKGCPAIPMFPIYDAIEHGTTMRPAAMPVPRRIADLKADTVGMAVRSRLSVALLTTPEAAPQAERDLRAWIAQGPTRASIRPAERFEVADGDVAVVLQVFDLRRP
jgi:hypothetical protein